MPEETVYFGRGANVWTYIACLEHVERRVLGDVEAGVRRVGEVLELCAESRQSTDARRSLLGQLGAVQFTVLHEVEVHQREALKVKLKKANVGNFWKIIQLAVESSSCQSAYRIAEAGDGLAQTDLAEHSKRVRVLVDQLGDDRKTLTDVTTTNLEHLQADVS